MTESDLDDALAGDSTDSDELDMGDLGADLDAAGDEGGGLDDLAADLGGGDEDDAAGGEGGGLDDLAADLGDLGGGDADDAGDEGGGLDLGELGAEAGDEGGGLDLGELGGDAGGDSEGFDEAGDAEEGGGGRDVVAVSRSQLSSVEAVNLDFLLDVKLDVTFEVGRAKMVISDLLTLGQGSVVELHRLVGEELDFLINGKLVAKAEVVVVNEKFGCRITEIVSPEDRIKHLGSYGP